MNEALQQSLYDKLSREQDKYRDWLKGQPPEEILHHSYEYTVREDILMSMEELTLSEAETRALLLSPSPMAILYDKFSDLETGYMDAIRDSIENRADDVCRAKEELRTTPVYPGTGRGKKTPGFAGLSLSRRPRAGEWGAGRLPRVLPRQCEL